MDQKLASQCTRTEQKSSAQWHFYTFFCKKVIAKRVEQTTKRNSDRTEQTDDGFLLSHQECVRESNLEHFVGELRGTNNLHP